MPQRLLANRMESHDFPGHRGRGARHVRGSSPLRASPRPPARYLSTRRHPWGFCHAQSILADRMSSRRLHLVGTPCPSFPWRWPNSSAPVVQVPNRQGLASPEVTNTIGLFSRRATCLTRCHLAAWRPCTRDLPVERQADVLDATCWNSRVSARRHRLAPGRLSHRSGRGRLASSLTRKAAGRRHCVRLVRPPGPDVRDLAAHFGAAPLSLLPCRAGRAGASGYPSTASADCLFPAGFPIGSLANPSPSWAFFPPAGPADSHPRPAVGVTGGRRPHPSSV